jgi:ubiquitin-conjugating enzyme E2 Z
MSLTTILHSILSIFGDTPFTNEPGFEELKTDEYKLLSDHYIDKITHESIRIAVIKRVEDLLSLSPKQIASNPWHRIVLTTFLQRKNQYLAVCAKQKHRDGKAFQNMPFEFPANQMSGKFGYKAMAERLEAVHGKLCDMIWSNQVFDLPYIRQPSS